MKRTTPLLFVFFVLVVSIGFLIMMPEVKGIQLQDENEKIELDNDFQYMFWQKRQVDLVVQAFLIVAGALSVALILPEDEGD